MYVCDFVVTFIITSITICVTFITLVILEKKKLLLKWLSIACLSSSYNPIRTLGHS